MGKRRWGAGEFGDERKIARSERKEASARDRSKYKKTNRDQAKKQEAPVPSDTLKRGRVLSISSEGMVVEHEAEQFICTLRGVLKKERTEKKNLVTVGDSVLFEVISQGEGVISYVEERKSVLSRSDNLHRRKEQLIAANIDQVLITVSVVTPPLKPALVDRYIIAAKKGNMEPIIVVNKCDLLSTSPEEQELYETFISDYKATGIFILSVSALTCDGLDALKEAMKDKVSVFSGQSGVGKSFLINDIAKTDLPVGEVVQKTRKGAHTTTTATLLPLEFGGWVIDTPGIKSFGVWDLDQYELQSYFPDINAVGHGCKFNDCSHTIETGCAVLEAVEAEELSFMRYESYLYLLESIKEVHRAR